MNHQCALGQFVVCEEVRMRIIIGKSEMKELTSEGKMERDIGRWTGVVSADAVLDWHGEEGPEPGDWLIDWLISLFSSINLYSNPTYSHVLWVVTERMRPQIQEADISFLRRVAGLIHRDRVKISGIQKELEQNCCSFERSQLKCFEYMIKMPKKGQERKKVECCPAFSGYRAHSAF